MPEPSFTDTTQFVYLTFLSGYDKKGIGDSMSAWDMEEKAKAVREGCDRWTATVEL